MKLCHSCKREFIIDGKVGRRDTCPHCEMDLHCCLNCRFYDKGAHNSCREPQSEPVADKEKSNFCDYFRFLDSDTDTVKFDKKENAKKKFESLFKKE